MWPLQRKQNKTLLMCYFSHHVANPSRYLAKKKYYVNFNYEKPSLSIFLIKTKLNLNLKQ